MESSKEQRIEQRKQKMLYPIQELDETFLTPLLAGGVHVDVMPGLHDPTNALLPQQPLHSSLLPNASMFECESSSKSYGMFHRCSNPYESRLQLQGGGGGGKIDVVLLGSDGTSIRDMVQETCTISKVVVEVKTKSDVDGINDISMTLSNDATEVAGASHTSAEEEQVKFVSGCAISSANSGDNILREMDALALSLQYGHMAPTSPDSMPCFPLLSVSDGDPFVINPNDHAVCSAKRESSLTSSVIYFMGNCAQFESREVTHCEGNKCQLLCIPSFSLTSEVVLVNTKTLHFETMKVGDLFIG